MKSGAPRRDLVFWHLIQSPHQAALVAELAARLQYHVTYAFHEEMSQERRDLGWAQPAMGQACLYHVADGRDVAAKLQGLGPDALHICQGLRANGVVGTVEYQLAGSGIGYGTILETVEDRGWRGLARRWLYRRALRRKRGSIRFILAIGVGTTGWLRDRGAAGIPTYEFAYFLDPAGMHVQAAPAGDRFVLGFVGQLIERKRVDLLLEAVASIDRRRPVRLVLVGDGPLRGSLERRARGLPPQVEVRWEGARPSAEARRMISGLDCLVLPSRHDGWGAVVSEALLAGVPAVCSDACGVAGVVECSGVGGVFRSGDAASLALQLDRIARQGPGLMDMRLRLAQWARERISGAAGAAYLSEILRHMEAGTGPVPVAPWRRVCW